MMNVRELSTAKYTATILDENKAVIPAASLTTLTLTLYVWATNVIINSRDNQNVLNANNVTVDSLGVLTWTMQPADNSIANIAAFQEQHRALFQWTYASGAKQGNHEVDIMVQNVKRIP